MQVGHSNLRVQIKTTRKSLRVAKKVSFEPWNMMKLDMKQDLNVLYQVCVFRADKKKR